jgi:hypothetical protein
MMFITTRDGQRLGVVKACRNLINIGGVKLAPAKLTDAPVGVIDP